MNLEHRLFFRVDFDLYTRLRSFCRDHGLKSSDALRIALEEYLSRHQ